MTEVFTFLIYAAIGASVTYDLRTYRERQAAWERDHPGQVYVCHYRRLQRQSRRHRRKQGDHSD